LGFAYSQYNRLQRIVPSDPKFKVKKNYSVEELLK